MPAVWPLARAPESAVWRARRLGGLAGLGRLAYMESIPFNAGRRGSKPVWSFR